MSELSHAQKMFNSGLMPTREQKALSLLIDARLQNKKVCIHENPITNKRHYVSGGYLPVWEFRGKYEGGSSGARRLRELRANHKEPEKDKNDFIFKKTHLFEDWDSVKCIMKTHRVVIRRLKMTPDEVLAYPWDKAFTLPFNWKYKEIKGQLELL